MEENDEKDILQILGTFENELGAKLKETNGELDTVKYYEKFTLKDIKNRDMDFMGVFITTEKDAEGKTSYHMYCGDASTEVLSIDADGNLKIKPELEGYFENINLEELMLENEQDKTRLKGMSEKIQHREKGEKENKEIEENEQENEQELQEEQLDEELQNEDLDLKGYKKIKDERLDEQNGENSKGVEERGVAYSRKLGAYVMIEKNGGQYQKAEGYEPAKVTMKTVYNVNSNGQQVEKKVPHALMQTNNSEKEMSISFDQYGYVETGMVDRMTTGERVERQLKGQEGKGDDNLVEEKGTDAQSINSYNMNEENLIIEEAAKDKVSVPYFKSLLQQASGSNLLEKIEDVHNTIEGQYRPMNGRN